MSGPGKGNDGVALAAGELVGGRYEIEHLLGGGGMAVVYRARHVVLEHPVALKVVSPAVRRIPGVAERFLREARAATHLKSEHIARVFDVGTLPDGAPYMVMEYLEGRDLGEVVAERGPLAPVECVDYVLQACEALAEVHGIGIVHRDLKPANLFLTRGADGLPHVKLIDFGISRTDAPLSGRDAASLTQPEAIMGSPRYMAPEQMEAASSSDARSDIWGLGAVLYELLTGDAPFDGASFLDIYAAAMRGPPRLPSEVRSNVPEGLDAVVLTCLQVDPDARFANVADLARALVPFGPARSEERAHSIARVLASARARVGGPPVMPEPLSAQLDPPQGSRVRPKLTGHAAARSGRRRTTWVLGLVMLGAVAAGGARAWSARYTARGAVSDVTPSPAPHAEPPLEAVPVGRDTTTTSAEAPSAQERAGDPGAAAGSREVASVPPDPGATPAGAPAAEPMASTASLATQDAGPAPVVAPTSLAAADARTGVPEAAPASARPNGRRPAHPGASAGKRSRGRTPAAARPAPAAPAPVATASPAPAAPASTAPSPEPPPAADAPPLPSSSASSPESPPPSSEEDERTLFEDRQ